MKSIIVEKPWGKFEQFTHNESSTVKIIYVNKGGSLSLQTHKHRSEFWKVISGSPMITIGGQISEGKAGDEFNIEAQIPHRIEAPNDDVEVLEIATGNFDENDIVRLEDKYHRA